MSIADGEYDIDISALLDRGNAPEQENSLGIRYGFIPDSMDQAGPLTLYQTENENLIRANTTDNSGDGSIIFEGNSQRMTSSKNPVNETYFLTISPHENKVAILKKLNSTIRVSKSRNAAKWESKMQMWNKENENKQNHNMVIPKIEAKASGLTTKPKQTQASKKPPSRDSKIKSNATIVDSDDESGFLGDHSNNEANFPDIQFKSEPTKEPGVKKVASTPQETISRPKKEVDRSVKSKEASDPRPTLLHKSITKDSSKSTHLAPTKPTGKRHPAKKPQQESDMDIDDDFKDLEDQLREVLEEEGTQPVNKLHENIADEDDDESDADDYYYSSRAPIKINFEERDSHRPPLVKSFSGNTQSKPRSLRDLVDSGTKKFDEDPSSEEE